MSTPALATSRPSAPPRPPWQQIFTSVLASTAALGTLVAMGLLTGHELLIPPMAASMALVAGAPNLPLAQPRNVVGGQVLSALIGVGVGWISHSLWAAAIAGALALGVMAATRTAHSPAAATAVIGCLATTDQASFVLCAAAASLVLAGAGWFRSRVGGPRYPTYWW
ncbi:HPP family protein [Zhihengliuella halotolerans]|uniref:HPP family protein n=1 Tax=Zhihengliuella halotolerans TaxID=370736 RepID=A0A4V2G9Y5_9MICC|nr:HPP family protein [Zhihengliuella halotolerans]RZU62216.1 HPP family protein [Zhihengliuella halotolerans]